MFFWSKDNNKSDMVTTPSQPSIPSVSYLNIEKIEETVKSFSRRKSQNIVKRQQPSNSVVHVTITAAGTVVYTHTATSYSYVPTYSTITGNNNSSSSNNGSKGNSTDNPNDNNSNGNMGAIIGGVVGGVAFIALIALGFFFMRKSKKKKRVLQQHDGGYIEDTGSYFRGAGGRASVGGIPGAGMNMTSSALPTPRHLVAPFAGLGTNREGDGSESKYYQHDGGYYDDIVPPNNLYPKSAYYSTTDSVTSDSLPSTTVDNNYYSQNYTPAGGFRHVPNEVDGSALTTTSGTPPPVISPVTEERHVPHLKENMEEPPHSKD